MTMSRAELASEVIAAVSAITEEQIERVNQTINEVITGLQIMHPREEIICEEQSDAVMMVIKYECIRRYLASG